MDKNLKKLIKIYQNLPYKPFRKTIGKLFLRYRKKTGTVFVKIDDINWALDLGDVVDNYVYYGNFEVDLTKRLKEIIEPGMICLDIGANMGYYTLLLAKLIGDKGKVFAFEPMNSFERLKTNVSLNNFNNIILEKKAVSDVSKSNENVNFKSHYRVNSEDIKKKEIVDCVSIDDYIFINNINKIDFIKIDVDGFESKVIYGAKETIKKFKPIIFIEIGYFENQPKKDIYKLIKFLSLYYNFFSEKDKFLKEDEVIKEINKLNIDSASNFVLINKEKYPETEEFLNLFYSYNLRS